MRAGYTFSNSSEHAPAHHGALAVLLDATTMRRIQGLLPLLGATCADIGAGGGSIARWLAGQVGPGGLVVATDINIRQLPEYPRLVVLEHDIATGPVPASGDGFDLVHARLVLNHLPERRMALHHMVQSLKPGGVLLTQDFLPTRSTEFVVEAPSEEDEKLLRRFEFHHLEILREHGNDRGWSQRAARMFEAEGLVDVREVVLHAGIWRGGGAGCQLMLAGLRQVDEKLRFAGLSAAEIHRISVLLDDERVYLKGHEVYSVSGRKPPVPSVVQGTGPEDSHG